MIGTIRKHSKWMWFIIITAIIITFVYWGASPNQFNSGSGGGTGNFGSINGERISAQAFANAQREVYLRYFFSYGEWPGTASDKRNFDVTRETYFRLILLKKLEQLGIHAGMAAIRQTRDNLLAVLAGQGKPPIPLEVFTDQILAKEGLTREDFRRFIANDLGIQQLIAAAGLPGRLVTPDEARQIYEREHTEIAAEAVFFSGSNHLAAVTNPAPEIITQFYSNNMSLYHLPDRVQVKYVEFPVSNYLASAKTYFQSVTNFDTTVESLAQALGTNFFKDVASPAEVKDKTRELMYKTNALAKARTAAAEFANEAFQEPLQAANLETVAKKKGLTTRVSEPFDQYGPSDLAVRPDFAREAMRLTTDEPLAGPLVGEEAVYVIALEKKLPKGIPPLETIRDRVAADYKWDQAVRAALKQGEAFASALTNGLAAGKKFSAICNEMHVRPVSIPPFSLATEKLPVVESHAPLDSFKDAAFRTGPGKASNFARTREGGFVIFVREKLPLELAKLNADLPAFMNAVRQNRQGEAFNMWFSREVERGIREIPYFQQQQQQQQRGGAPQT